LEEGALRHVYTWDVDVIVPLTLTVGANPIEIFADGTSTSTITATVMSADESLAGAVVTFATTLGYVSPITATTDVSGTATVTLTSGDVIGTATVTAIVGSSSNSVEVEFITLPKIFLPLVRKQ
jgi:adhesin/invasin